MKGDFSNWRFDAMEGFQGVLYQQGRLISDTDLTEAELQALMWRLTAGRDIIGANVAAVPAAEPNGYKVLNAAVDGDTVLVELDPGRIWADGLHLRLADDPANPGAPVLRRASYLPTPHNPAGTGTGDIGDGVRDAIILELRLEELNGFQDPRRLIEPALGGPDTAERIIPHAAIRLLRLGDNEDCTNIGPRLRDNLAGHGRLTVSLEPQNIIAGDCPVVEGGGYSGFEHNLYRIEIAATDGGPARFKWSQFNGGLVGRGQFFGGVAPHVDITANRSAILNSGLTEFYLEALEFDDELGHWRVTYGTPAALNADEELDLAQPPTFGAIPGAGAAVFFRLWNGIREIGDFTDAANPVELRDGIRLAFQPPAGATYRPGSWWNFDVRAGEISNDEMLIDDRPPQGPVIRRVPLAEITWTDARDTRIGGEIEDCRRRFRPLTNQKICCTYIVGNGVTTFGDFNSLEEAAAHLPPSGGRLCLLPGLHFANLDLVNKRGIQIQGCRHRTFLFPRASSFDQPIIRIRGGQDYSISEVDFIAPFGIAIDVEGNTDVPLKEVLISGCRIMALTFGIHAESLFDLRVSGNQIWLLDHPRGISTISVRAIDALIEKNHTGVWPFEFKPPNGGGDDDEEPDPADPCIEPDELFGNIKAVIIYVANVWVGGFSVPPAQPYRARGGIHVKGSSERIDIRRNRIDGGLWHGITLGGVFADENVEDNAPDDGASDPALANPTVRAVNGQFVGVIRNEAGEPQADVTVTFAKPGGSIVRSAVSKINGEIGFKLDDGTYIAGVDPEFDILAVDTFATGAALVHIITIGAVRDDVPVNPDAGFLTRIRILDNQIERMGLSGVGFWFHAAAPGVRLVPSGLGMEALAEFMSAVLAPKELIGTTNLVRDLVIRGNRIENNLQAVFTDILRKSAQLVAQGGISLAMTEGVRIEDNHITGNGLSAVNPCAGIFVGYGEEILISGNYIAGNGPVDEDYRTQRSDGLRGGIFIRLASAVIAGGTADGQQKPALVIRDNTVDQPAGRAITAFAYGPVSCIGNTLNSENEGAWSVVDNLIGTVLIANLGGVHRFQAFNNLASKDFLKLGTIADVDNASNATAASHISRFDRQVEVMLPGGETLFNSNRVRSGPDNKSWTSQVIVTLDDLGYDANQSGTFRPDVTLSNTVAIAHTLRLTDNRFKERAAFTAMSALTLTGGTTVSGGASAMNMTTQNQGDHCIVAMSLGTQPVVETPNQIVHNLLCPGSRPNNLSKQDYVIGAFVLAWQYSVAPDFQPTTGAIAVEASLEHSTSGLEQFHRQTQLEYSREAHRYEVAYGAGHPQARELKEVAANRREVAAMLSVQTELVGIKEAAVPEAGALLDGRVANKAGSATGQQIVELVTKDGEPLGFSAKTNDAGYYKLNLSEEEYAKLAGHGDVFVRVRTEDGKTVSREPQKISFTGDRLVRNNLEVISSGPILSVNLGDAKPVFRRTEPVERKPTPDTPSPDDGSDVSINITEVEGIGPTRAAQLREAGIDSAKAMLDLSNEALTRIVGGAAQQLRKSAKKAIANARRGRTRR